MQDDLRYDGSVRRLHVPHVQRLVVATSLRLSMQRFAQGLRRLVENSRRRVQRRLE